MHVHVAQFFLGFNPSSFELSLSSARPQRCSDSFTVSPSPQRLLPSYLSPYTLLISASP